LHQNDNAKPIVATAAKGDHEYARTGVSILDRFVALSEFVNSAAA